MSTFDASRVAELVRGLDQLDPGGASTRRVFGAAGHDYKLARASAEDLTAVETTIGVSLPSEFREFLANAGSGAGPYYGIYAPMEIEQQFKDLCGEADLGGHAAPDPSASFPLTAAHALEARQAQTSIEATVLLPGCIVIGHQGSGTQWTVLVTAGDLTGTVWDLAWFVGLDGEWYPARKRPTVHMEHVPTPERTVPPTFGEWYSDWLDTAQMLLKR